MSSTVDDTYRTKLMAADQQLIEGLAKHGQALGSLLLVGASYKAADLTTVLQARIAAQKAVSPARSAWQAVVLGAKAERAKTKALIAGLRQALITAYEATPDTLADFGLTPRKKRVVKAQTKATAAVKAKTTREVLGTMGTKQKKAAKAKATSAGTAPAATAPAATPSQAPAPSPAVAPAPTPPRAT